MRALLTVSLLALLAGCGAPTLDASSEESLKASMQKVNAELTPEKQAELKKALASLAFRGIMSVPSDSDGAITGFQEKLNGKTAEEVIEMAAAKP
jgi:hypothetical protein